MSSRMNIAVIVAGGSGLRVGGAIPKQFLKIGGKEMIEYSVQTFCDINDITKVIVVCHQNYITHTEKLFEGNSKVSIITGGKTRFESSFNALKFIKENKWNNSNVLIHDAARPFVSKEIIQNCILELIENHAAVVAVPVTDTISITKNGIISEIPPRNILFAHQTPQCFWFEEIFESYINSTGEDFTDDVSVFLTQNIKVQIIKGDAKNRKITTAEDLKTSMQE